MKHPQIQQYMLMTSKCSNDIPWELPINNKTLSELQQKDMFCNNILKQIEKGNIKEGQLYVLKDNILKRYVVDGNDIYKTVTVHTKSHYCSNTLDGT